MAIIGTKDCPIYELEFGTYRQGGDGISRVSTKENHGIDFIVLADDTWFVVPS